MVDRSRIIFECQQMFRHACAFSECSDFAKKEFRHDTADIDWYITPAIVNSAFACEVYLKALLKYHNIDVNWIHGIKELYESLPKRVKDWIEPTVKNNYGGMWKDAWGNDLLDYISNAFIDWRYKYEHDWGKSSSMHIEFGFLTVFRDALREACSQLFFGKTWEEYKS